MHFLLLNHVQNALQSLKKGKVRSFLTMLGIAIGVASITAILAISYGANQAVNDQINSAYENIAIVRPGRKTNPVLDITKTKSNESYAISTLTEDDLTKISSVTNVKMAAPVMILSGTIKADSLAPIESSIVATTPNLAKISNLELRDGQFIDDEVSQNAVVIGTQLSINVFGTESSIGRSINIRGQSFVVIGVLKKNRDPINFDLIDFNNVAIISFSMGKKFNQNASQIQQINVKIDPEANYKETVSNINKLLLENHANENNFSVLSGNEISVPTSQLFQIVTGFTTVTAAISLVVGGIGVMNIMLVTVAERTREIGIRKALGARNYDIACQFLIESLIISLAGGFFGYLIGHLISLGASTILSFKPVINWQIALVALLISLVTGIVFGIYPALRAASKDPIESLHQYS